MNKVLEFPKPAAINAIRGATPADAKHTREMVSLCFDLFVSAMQGHIGNLRENSTVRFDNFSYELAQIADARKSILDSLEVLEDDLANYRDRS